MTNLDGLTKKIKQAFSKEQLINMGVPENEMFNYERFKIMPVELIIKAEWNYKTENENLSQKLQNNLKRNSQVENIIVRLLETGYYEVCNGNHRHTEIINLGRKFIIVYDLGSISLSEAQRLTIETNETKFETNNVQLADLIKNISLDFDITDLINTLPYSETEIENFSKLTEFNWDQFEDNQPTELDESSETSENIEISNEQQLTINLSPETFALWQDVKEKFLNIEGIDSEIHVFEIILNEASKIPDKKLLKLASELIITEDF